MIYLKDSQKKRIKVFHKIFGQKNNKNRKFLRYSFKIITETQRGVD